MLRENLKPSSSPTLGVATMVLARLWEVMQTTTRDSVAQFLLLSSLVALSGRLVKMSHQHDDEKNALMEQLQAERDRLQAEKANLQRMAQANAEQAEVHRQMKAAGLVG